MEAVREGELHPLQNPTILGEIFKKLKKLEDLKSCRLVCREWYRGSTKAMKPIPSVVRIRWQVADFLQLVNVEGEENAYAVPPFMQHFELYRLEGASRTFWEVCGSNIRSLDLGWVVFESGDNFRHAIFQSCPNLETLSMCHVRVGDERRYAKEPNEGMPPRFPRNRNLKSIKIDNTEMGGVSWMEVLGQFPALEKFDAGSGVGSLPGFFRSLSLARQNDDQCWNIKDLSFDLDGIDGSLSTVVPAFEDLKLPLEKLCVFCIDPIVQVIALQRFLSVHASKLRDLILGGKDLRGSPMMELFRLQNYAVFENVRNLSLFHARLPSVSFLQSFPNLERLELNRIRPLRGFSQEPVGNWILGSCTKLDVDMKRLKTEDVRQLLSKLPNLEILEVLDTNNDKFQVICELLPKLEHLELTDGLVNDIGISGLDDEDVARINEEGPEGDWRPMTVARPNLTGLMNLKRFRMDGLRFVELGYTTATCLQQLPHLQEFCLEEYGRLHPTLDDLQIHFPWTSQCNSFLL